MIFGYTILFMGLELNAENCKGENISLYFSNGMFNSRMVANKSGEALSRLSHRPVKIAYNLNENAFTELLQVARQKDDEYARLFWRELAGTVEEYEEKTILRNFLKPMRLKMLALSKTYDHRRYLKDPDLRRHVRDYLDDLKQGKSISVVAHSQGNFYANSAGELLRPDEQLRFSVMAVATPAKTVFRDGPYLTLVQDKPMAAVRLTQGALPANHSTESSTYLGHEFIAEYLKGASAIFETELQSILWDETSEDHFEPSFIDPSLHPFWRFALNVLTDAPRKLLPQECLAILSFSKVYRAGGDTCRGRNLESLLKLMNECRETDWKPAKTYLGFWSNNCSLGSTDEFSMQAGSLASEIENAHPECFDTRRGTTENLIEPNFDAAVRMIKNPPHRTIPK